MVDHPVTLTGLRFAGSGPRPTILERKDQDFIPALLEELKRDSGRQQLNRSLAATRETSGVLKLFQPVHRTFNIALLEAFCDTAGQPRLDPSRIDSAGLLVRRAALDGRGVMRPGRWEGWMQVGKRIQGWSVLQDYEIDRDPDATRRPPELRTGHKEINARYAARFGETEPRSESFTRMFPAPPEVCEAARKTMLFSIVPLVSPEIAEAASLPSFDATDLEGHLPAVLRTGDARTLSLGGTALRSLSPDDSAVADFMTLVRQVAIEFDAFGPAAESRALFNSLNALVLTMPNGTSIGAGDFLKIASKVLLERQFSSAEGATQMPSTWPQVTTAQANVIASSVLGAMQTRLRQVASGQGRFDAPNRQYHIRAFIRVRSHADCPPRLIWSEPSEPFTIAPWFDNNGAPPVQVIMPDATNRDFLKKLKPNVSFVMPENLFNLLQNKSKAFMDEKAGIGESTGIMWICSFSIPIITLCAFIVLNIFLTLFDIIFSWMLFIKICLPLPKPKS
jgi:hypothetical protein